MDKFENADMTNVMCACGHLVMCAHAMPCIKAFLGLRQRFNLDGKHFILFRGRDVTGLAWTENIIG